jgi:curved DNA-binding protein CbpA
VGEEKKAFDDWISLFGCDDPYWKVPKRYIAPERLGGMHDKLERLEALYPECTDDLYNELPSYYGVLGVSKKSSKDDVKEAYERKKKYSGYPPDVIERAYEMLSDDKKRSTYDKILRLFLNISQALPLSEKEEMIHEHVEWLNRERERATVGYIKEKHNAWIDLFFRGAPTFYEVLNENKNKNKNKNKNRDKIKDKNSKNRLRLVEALNEIIKDKQLKWEYDFMRNIFNKILNRRGLEAIKRKKAFWRGKEGFYFALLKYHNYLDKYNELLGKYPDWKEYTGIGDGKETFYEVLDIDMDRGVNIISEDKYDTESFIRNAYKDKERTPKVNLAYSVLKNSKLREEYNWLLRNGKWVSVLSEVDIEKVDKGKMEEIVKFIDGNANIKEG